MDIYKVISKFRLQAGVCKDFFSVKHINFGIANAFVTSHPLRGLDWLIELWCNLIHNKAPWAELHIYSNLLYNNKLSKNVKISNLQLKIFSKKNTGIFIKKPLPQNQFVKLLSNYRVHINPVLTEASQFTTILEIFYGIWGRQKKQ